MLEDFMKTLEVVKDRIRDHRKSMEKYEARTRVSLIDPILCALGWDVSDPACVRIEREIGDTNSRVDYALLGESGQPIVFIEAKKLSEKEPDFEQIARYVTQQRLRGEGEHSVQYFVWTNGDMWRAWDMHDMSKDPQLIHAEMSSERTDKTATAKTALKLMGLWRESLIGQSFVPATPLREDDNTLPSNADKERKEKETKRQQPRKRRRWERLSAEHRAALIADLKAGKLSRVAIADKYDISRGAVDHHARRIMEGKS